MFVSLKQAHKDYIQAPYGTYNYRYGTVSYRTYLTKNPKIMKNLRAKSAASLDIRALDKMAAVKAGGKVSVHV